MAISPVNFFSPFRTSAANDVQSFANLSALSSLTGLPATTLAALSGTAGQVVTTFAGTLGQLLADLGPLALDTALGGTGTTTAAPATGLTNTVFDLLLLSSLGQGQPAGQSAAQQLLTQRLLLGTVNTTDQLGLTNVATNQLLTTLVRQGADGNLFVQLSDLATRLDPQIFSASVLAQAFSIGNDIGTPA